MKKLFVSGLGLMVTLARLVPGQVGLMYKVMTAEDVESSFRLLGSLIRKNRFIHAYDLNGDEIIVLTSFASVEEAESFLTAA